MRILTDSERVARAYATLDLPPGVPADAALRQYRRLAKQWHPDLWANDPAGQLDASRRMRQINAAFAVIRPRLRRTTAAASTPHASTSSVNDHRNPPPFGRRLHPDEVDSIVESMAEPSMFEQFFVHTARALLFVAGLNLVGIGNQYHKPFDVVFGGLLAAGAVVHLLVMTDRGRRSPRDRWNAWYNR